MSHPLRSGAPPAWADCWGEDVYGVWAGFVVGGVEHRLRWIPGGRALLGSPDKELGRFEDEAQRWVDVEDSWLGEVPVTQALYTAVMGRNPSRFQSSAVPWLCADRPVEQVSWDDAQAFLEKLNGERPELELELPSEDGWEYACRAGTTKATYAGDLETAGGRSQVLDRIAWYDESSRREFDLLGFPLAGGETAQQGTHRVARLAPNAYGLYDMLGNVWEWCATERGAPRVCRGGSWSLPAQYCRAAYRLGHHPGYRDDDLGFRVSRGQAQDSSPGSSTPRRTARRRPREKRGQG